MKAWEKWLIEKAQRLHLRNTQCVTNMREKLRRLESDVFSEKKRRQYSLWRRNYSAIEELAWNSVPILVIIPNISHLSLNEGMASRMRNGSALCREAERRENSLIEKRETLSYLSDPGIGNEIWLREIVMKWRREKKRNYLSEEKREKAASYKAKRPSMKKGWRKAKHYQSVIWLAALPKAMWLA